MFYYIIKCSFIYDTFFQKTKQYKISHELAVNLFGFTHNIKTSLYFTHSHNKYHSPLNIVKRYSAAGPAVGNIAAAIIENEHTVIGYSVGIAYSRALGRGLIYCII